MRTADGGTGAQAGPVNVSLMNFEAERQRKQVLRGARERRKIAIWSRKDRDRNYIFLIKQTKEHTT